MRIKNVQDSADLFIDYPERHLLVIEAKRNGNLEEFIPQVVAQCLAMYVVLNFDYLFVNQQSNKLSMKLETSPVRNTSMSRERILNLASTGYWKYPFV